MERVHYYVPVIRFELSFGAGEAILTAPAKKDRRPLTETEREFISQLLTKTVAELVSRGGYGTLTCTYQPGFGLIVDQDNYDISSLTGSQRKKFNKWINDIAPNAHATKPVSLTIIITFIVSKATTKIS